jgi:hypothetical protein
MVDLIHTYLLQPLSRVPQIVSSFLRTESGASDRSKASLKHKRIKESFSDDEFEDDIAPDFDKKERNKKVAIDPVLREFLSSLMHLPLAVFRFFFLPYFVRSAIH